MRLHNRSAYATLEHNPGVYLEVGAEWLSAVNCVAGGGPIFCVRQHGKQTCRESWNTDAPRGSKQAHLDPEVRRRVPTPEVVS